MSRSVRSSAGGHPEWRVDTLSDVSVADSLQTRWQRVDPPTRAALTELVAEAVLGEVKDDPWYSTFSSPPRVEVLGAREHDGALRIYFIADHLNYCQAQSGSDWANHDLFTGVIDLRDGDPSPVRLEHVKRANVTEREWDAGYDREPSFSWLREQALARTAPPPSGRT